ncbi:MAG: hypothetical protein AAGB04_21985, partial [Pseudomonadota bacterium]
ADWILDIGPNGGDGGGEIVAVGTPEDVAATEGSHTGEFLKDLLKRRGHAAVKTVTKANGKSGKAPAKRAAAAEAAKAPAKRATAKKRPTKKSSKREAAE